SLRLWDTVTAQSRAVLAIKPDNELALAFSPDGTRLATALPYHEVRLWDTHTGQEQATLPGRSAAVKPLLFSPDGRLLIKSSSSAPLTLQLWEVETGQKRASSAWPGYYRQQVLAFTPDDSLLIAADFSRFGKDGRGPDAQIQLSLIDPVTGEERATVTH